MNNQGYALMGWDQDAAAFGNGGVGYAAPVLVGAVPGSQGQVRVVEQQYTQERGLLMPFPSTAVAASSIATATATPQTMFRPSSLTITATAITGLNVLDIRIGKNSQTVASGAMPAEAFAPTSTYKGLQLDTARPGITIDLELQDTSAALNTAVALMYGVAATGAQ